MSDSDIVYWNRESGSFETEKVYGEFWLKFIYNNPLGKVGLWAMVKRAWFSHWYGKKMSASLSAEKIIPFIKKYGLKTDDFLDSVECSIEAQAKGRFYNISSGKPLSFKSMIMEYASKIHGVEKSRNVPLLPLRILSSIAPNQRINHYSLDQITKPMRLDISESVKDLGWSPKQTFSECLEELI